MTDPFSSTRTRSLIQTASVPQLMGEHPLVSIIPDTSFGENVIGMPLSAKKRTTAFFCSDLEFRIGRSRESIYSCLKRISALLASTVFELRVVGFLYERFQTRVSCFSALLVNRATVLADNETNHRHDNESDNRPKHLSLHVAIITPFRQVPILALFSGARIGDLSYDFTPAAQAASAAPQVPYGRS